MIESVAPAPLRGRGRHVELLLDDRRADGGKADDQRDDLQVLRFAQQVEGFGGADALLLFDRGDGSGFDAARAG